MAFGVHGLLFWGKKKWGVCISRLKQQKPIMDGKQFASLRNRLGLNQRQMSAVIDYSKSFVKMLETGKRTPPPGFGVHVAKKIRQWAADVTNTVTNEAEKIECQEETGNN